MKGRQCLMHAVVSHAVGPPVQPPATFLDVSRAFTNNDSDSGRATVENHSLHDFLPPRTGARNKDDVTGCKPMVGHPPACLTFKHDDVVTEKAPLGSRTQVKQSHTGKDEALLCPRLPSFFDQLSFVVQFLLDQFSKPCEVVLAAAPTIGHGFILRHGRLGR